MSKMKPSEGAVVPPVRATTASTPQSILNHLFNLSSPNQASAAYIFIFYNGVTKASECFARSWKRACAESRPYSFCLRGDLHVVSGLVGTSGCGGLASAMYTPRLWPLVPAPRLFWSSGGPFRPQAETCGRGENRRLVGVWPRVVYEFEFSARNCIEPMKRNVFPGRQPSRGYAYRARNLVFCAATS